jgi:hypothetical protein
MEKLTYEDIAKMFEEFNSQRPKDPEIPKHDTFEIVIGHQRILVMKNSIYQGVNEVAVLSPNLYDQLYSHLLGYMMKQGLENT